MLWIKYPLYYKSISEENIYQRLKTTTLLILKTDKDFFFREKYHAVSFYISAQHLTMS